MTEPVKEIPRLSASIAKILLERSPLHAWQAHRLLGGGDDKDSTEAQNTGKILEYYILGHKQETIEILDFKDFRTKAAQAALEQAEAKGKTVMLKKEEATFLEMAAILKKNLSDRGFDFNGKCGLRIEWESDGVACSGELDHFILGLGRIDDLKAVADASNKALNRAMVDYGWDVQGAAYLDWLRVAHPVVAERGGMYFHFCEKKKPYAVNPKKLSGQMLELGESKWARAKRIWKKCMKTGVWPGYPDDELEPAIWAMSQEMEKTITEDFENQNPPLAQE